MDKKQIHTISEYIVTYFINNAEEIQRDSASAIEHISNILEMNTKVKTQVQDLYYTAYFDGSSIPNPGTMKIGCYIKDITGKIIYTDTRNLGHGTNNIAEYRALIHVLEELVKRGAEKAQIFGDSQLVVNQINGEYKVNRKKYKHIGELYDKAMELLSQINTWTLSHVKREHNKLADQLSRR
jgi:ribonuclease HI